MKNVFIIMGLASLLGISCGFGFKKSNVRSGDGKDSLTEIPADFYALEVLALDSQQVIRMSDYRGKKVLLVNVASKCGYTYQYEQLQELHEKYGNEVQVIGFPCNQFMFQEPGSGDQIQQFCSVNYGVTFPLSTKINVKGGKRHPLYTWLTSKEFNGKGDYAVSWNFNKFLISEEGELLAYFDSKTEPMSDEILAAIGVK